MQDSGITEWTGFFLASFVFLGLRFLAGCVCFLSLRQPPAMQSGFDPLQVKV